MANSARLEHQVQVLQEAANSTTLTLPEKQHQKAVTQENAARVQCNTMVKHARGLNRDYITRRMIDAYKEKKSNE
ncbi:mechanosensitive channel protein [Escherichia coli]|nr:mechanosensitive channel protein [Escherichia coli]